MSTWTSDRVKAELPALRIYHMETRTEVTGQVRDRHLPCATVHATVSGVECRWVYGWAQIALALNSNVPLIA